jgi:hypothetical protein
MYSNYYQQREPKIPTIMSPDVDKSSDTDMSSDADISPNAMSTGAAMSPNDTTSSDNAMSQAATIYPDLEALTPLLPIHTHSPLPTTTSPESKAQGHADHFSLRDLRPRDIFLILLL